MRKILLEVSYSHKNQLTATGSDWSRDTIALPGAIRSYSQYLEHEHGEKARNEHGERAKNYASYRDIQKNRRHL